MVSWLGAHWRAILGGSALLLPLWQGFRSLLSVVGDVDLVVSKVNDPGWLASVWSFLNNLPAYVYLALVVIGLLMIWLDARGIWAGTTNAPRSIEASNRLNMRPPVAPVAKKSGSTDSPAPTTARVVSAISDRATAEAFLNKFADDNGLDGFMPGKPYKGGFNRYVAAYNSAKGHVALAVRMDDPVRGPYVYVDQNSRKDAKRHSGREYEITEVEEAVRDFLKRRKNGYTERRIG